MKVVATRQGFYNQILREPGEVFQLLNKADGSMPEATRVEPVLDKDGLPIPRRFKRVAVKDEHGKPVHAHFAKDLGSQLCEDGPSAGESIHLGWMLEVPERVPVGRYPPDTDFWTENVMLPPAVPVQIGQQDRRAAPIKNVA